jgi:ankyrin repeat protein
VLLQKGASINAKDSTGSTALHRAAGTAKLAAVKALLGIGKADLTAEDKEGSTALLVAVTCGSDAVAVALAAAGADLNAADKQGNSPLRCGASSRLAPYKASASASIESPKMHACPSGDHIAPLLPRLTGSVRGPWLLAASPRPTCSAR